jgi:glycerol kinase
MAYQTRDVVDAMRRDSGLPLESLRVDGGASINDKMMQFQADMLDVPVARPQVRETTALGAAYLAGLAVGYWSDLADIDRNWVLDRRFEPNMPDHERTVRYAGWLRAVERSRDWAQRDG